MITNADLILLHHRVLTLPPTYKIAIGSDYACEAHQLLSVLEDALTHREHMLTSRPVTFNEVVDMDKRQLIDAVLKFKRLPI